MRQKIALLIDFDNVILGIDDPGFDVEIVVNALRERGLIVLGRAYGDWYRHNRHRRRLMEQGIDLIETPVFGPIIKNSADMHMALDAFEIAHTQPHIDTFCIVSGDSDFLPLIKRLQSRDKMVIVIAGHKFTSELVRRNCNEYMAYENLLAESVGATEDVTILEGAYQLLERTIATLLERDIEVRSSTVKQMMVQLNPAFSERNFGCAQFKQFLDRAARAGVVKLGDRDSHSGEFIVVPLNDAVSVNGNGAAPTLAPPTAAPESDSSRSRRGRRTRNERPERSERAERVTPETAPISATPLAPESVPVAPESVPEEANDFRDPHSILGRVPLRRGRLRFSAREGRTTLNRPNSGSDTPGETGEDTLPTPAEVIETTEEISEILPILEAIAGDENTAENAPKSDDDAQVLAEAADEKPARKRTSRGGRKRKKSTEATDDAPQVLGENAEPNAEEPNVEAAPEVAAPNATAALEIAPEVAETAALETEKAAPKKRSRRSKSAAAKAAAAENADAAPSAEIAAESDAKIAVQVVENSSDGNAPVENSSVETASAATDDASEVKPKRARRAPRRRATAKDAESSSETAEA